MNLFPKMWGFIYLALSTLHLVLLQYSSSFGISIHMKFPAHFLCFLLPLCATLPFPAPTEMQLLPLSAEVPSQKFSW